MAAAPTIGPSSVDRLARTKRPVVERSEIHIPPVPLFPLEAVTGDPRMRAQAVANYNLAVQKWRNDAWSVEAPFVPDSALQNRATSLEDTTSKLSVTLTQAVVDIDHIEENITTIQNNLTTINTNAITGTGIVQANGDNPPTAILGTQGHVPYWNASAAPYLAATSPIYTDGTLVGIGTDLPAYLLDLGLAGTRAGIMRLAGSTSGNVIIQTAAVAGTWTLTLPTNDGDASDVLTTDGAGVTSWTAPTTVTPSALTRTNDTNVTLTLGGAPATALLAATSLTLGWTGVLAIARGGTNASSFSTSTGIITYNGTQQITSSVFTISSTLLKGDGAGANAVFRSTSSFDGILAGLFQLENTSAAATANAGASLEWNLNDTTPTAYTGVGTIQVKKSVSWTSTASTRTAIMTLNAFIGGSLAQHLALENANVVCGNNDTSATRVDDFLHIPSSAGNPSGAATEYGSRVPMAYDTTNNRLFCYNPTDNTWRSVVLA